MIEFNNATNFKEIHIGQMLKMAVTESGIEISRICHFLKSDEEEIQEMFQQKSIDTHLLLRWSKLLGYDFFRLYSQHLIFYAPPSSEEKMQKKWKTVLPQFRKNIYTREFVNLILEQISTGEMTKSEVMEKYKIPKTTLYKWISKYKN